MKTIYAIVDIETTGGSYKYDRITEIGIALHDGQKILETYESLINPGRTIPQEITRITGITNEMVSDAPKFHEVAKRVVELTEGAIFVAHNVHFDYNFIRQAFGELGYTFTRKKLCTVRLSRRVFPGLKSYSLANLIKHFSIKVARRHRALDDVLATVEVLERCFAAESSPDQVQDLVRQGITSTRLPQGITFDIIQSMPEDTGIYYFYDESHNVVYVGKAINIQKRVVDHFGGQSKKSKKVLDTVRSMGAEVTGSELVALLFESQEIKRLTPDINRALKSRSSAYKLYAHTSIEGYRCLHVAKQVHASHVDVEVIKEYNKKSGAQNHLSALTEEFELCRFLNGLETMSTPCFQYHVGLCHGACIDKESPKDYNSRVLEACASIQHRLHTDSFLIIDKGRTIDERSLVWVNDGQYMGFGYCDWAQGLSIEDLLECILPSNDPTHPDQMRIILSWLAQNAHSVELVTL